MKDRIEFVKVGGADAEKLPIGPNTAISDDIGFQAAVLDGMRGWGPAHM